MENPFSLVGKTILVTGASSGIGRGIAISCAGMGANLIITGRNRQKLEKTLSMMEGANHHIIVADLTVESDRNALVSQLPNLDGVVNNAGVGSRVLCKNVIKDDIDYIFNTNVYAPILLQTGLLQKKIIKKGASIVFIASMGAFHPYCGNSIYSASKGAIISYAKCLGLEVAPRKIRVNCICPGMVWTDLIIQEGVTKEELIEAQSKYALKRYGTPEDISGMAVYLLSDSSKWITGANMEISGGGEGTLM